MIRVCPTLGRDHVLLATHRPLRIDHAILENHGCVSKDKVDGAVNVAFLVELAFGVDVESVLVPFESTVIENREVGSRSESHGLVVLRTGSVLECDSPCNESITRYSYNSKTSIKLGVNKLSLHLLVNVCFII